MKEQDHEGSDPKRLLITIEEAARRLSVGRSHLYEQMQRGGLRSVRIGRSRRILEQDLETFIDELLSGPPNRASQTMRPTPKPVKAALPSRSGRR